MVKAIEAAWHATNLFLATPQLPTAGNRGPPARGKGLHRALRSKLPMKSAIRKQPPINWGSQGPSLVSHRETHKKNRDSNQQEDITLPSLSVRQGYCSFYALRFLSACQ